MALLTREDLRRHSAFAWACLLLLLAVAGWFWTLEKHRAAMGTLAAATGCLALILPPRERMGAVLPPRLRALPRVLDAAPVLAALLSSPGYGLNWFYGANPYDEVVHLASGLLAGAVLAGLLGPGAPGRKARIGLACGLALGIGWEVFEAATGLIGDWPDTLSDIALTATGVALGAAGWAAWAAPRGGTAPAARSA